MDHMQEHRSQSEEKPQDAALPASPAASVHRRVRTQGEKIFDLSIYGGISFVANEILSGKIQNQTIEKTGKFYGYYEAALNGMHRLFKKEANPKQWQNWIKRPTDIFVMTLGGTLLVPAVKFFETHKSDLVRFYDRTFHGQRMENEPAIRAAHEEMEREPKQSWGSLGKARLVTIGAAIGIDYLIGDKNAVSTRIWDNNWSSMHRANVQLTRKIAGYFQPEFKSAIAEAAKTSPHDILKTEGRLANIGRTYGFLLFLSAALAAGFYASSRIFARRREEHRLYQQLHGHVPAPEQPAPPADTAREAQPAEATISPTTQVRNVSTDTRLQPAPQLSAGAA